MDWSKIKISKSKSFDYFVILMDILFIIYIGFKIITSKFDNDDLRLVIYFFILEFFYRFKFKSK